MNQELERFLSEIEKRLTILTPHARAREIEEMRQHLEMLIRTNVTAGVSEHAATLAAIGHFGTAEDLARELNHSAWRRCLKRLPDEAVAVLTAFAAAPLISCVATYLLAPALNAISGVPAGFVLARSPRAI